VEKEKLTDEKKKEKYHYLSIPHPVANPTHRDYRTTNTMATMSKKESKLSGIPYRRWEPSQKIKVEPKKKK